jgi:hypothetical protein
VPDLCVQDHRVDAERVIKAIAPVNTCPNGCPPQCPPGYRGCENGMIKLEALIILPAQLATSPEWLPEQRLMAAVLEEAFRCVHGKALIDGGAETGEVRRRRRLVPQQAAARWFESPDTSWPFSFENVCVALRLDAEALRQRLRVAAPSRRYRPTTTRHGARTVLVAFPKRRAPIQL